MTFGARHVLGKDMRQVGDRRTIPFDYSFRFRLPGVSGKTLKETLTISVEGSFTAVSIGYGAVPETEPFDFGLKNEPGAENGPVPSKWSEVTLPGIFDGLSRAAGKRGLKSGAAASGESRVAPIALLLRAGIRVNPKYRDLIPPVADLAAGNIAPGILEDLFQAVVPRAAEIQFTYALFDDGSGREFQSEPVLSTAGLGSPAGERPFRRFAPPVTFAPRSAVRMQVTQLDAFKGELHIALHGYKNLGGQVPPMTPGGRPDARRERR